MDYKHWVFISYAHKDAKFARRLKRKLEGSKVSDRFQQLCANPPAEGTDSSIFLDRDDIVKDGRNLPDVIVEEILQAQKLVVICSPNSAGASSHVALEIDVFIKAGRWKDIHPIIADGDPKDIFGPQDCFPAALRFSYDSDGARIETFNPLSPDFRSDPWLRSRDELANLMSSLLLVDKKKLFDIYRRRRGARVLGLIALGSAVCLTVGLEAYQVNESNRKTNLAERYSTIAGAASLVEAAPYDAATLILKNWPSSPQDLPTNADAGLEILSKMVRTAVKPTRTVHLTDKIVAIAPDGSRVITTEDNGNDVKGLRDVLTGEEIGEISGENVEFSPDSTRILSWSMDGSARIWDAKTGSPLSSKSLSELYWAAFEPDSKKVLLASAKATVPWDVGIDVLRKPIENLPFHPHSGYMTPDSKLAIFGSISGYSLVDLTTSKVLPARPYLSEMSISAISHDGTTLLTWSNQTVTLWDLKSGKILQRYPHDDDIQEAKFLANDRVLVATKTAVYVHDKETAEINSKLSGGFPNIAIAPDGKTVLLGSENGNVKQWYPGSSNEAFELEQGSGDTSQFFYSISGKSIFTAVGERLAVWNTNNETTVDAKIPVQWSNPMLLPSQHASQLLAVLDRNLSYREMFSGREISNIPLGNRPPTAVSGAESGLLLVYEMVAHLWDAVHAKELLTFGNADQKVTNAIFSNDNRQVLTASKDGVVRLFDKETGAEMRSFFVGPKSPTLLQFSNDDKYVLVTLEDNTVQIWSIQTNKKLDLPGDQNISYRFAIPSRKGCLFFLQSNDNDDLHLWKIEHERVVQLWQRNIGWGPAVSSQFRKNNSEILLASGHAVFVLDTLKGTDRYTLPEHGTVTQAYFSEDGSRIVAVSDDRTAGLWDTKTARLLRRFYTPAGIVDDLIFTSDEANIVFAVHNTRALSWQVVSLDDAPKRGDLLDVACRVLSERREAFGLTNHAEAFGSGYCSLPHSF